MEGLLRHHRSQVLEKFKSLPSIENRVEAIEVDSPRFLGKTEKTFLELKRSLAALKTTTLASNQLLGKLDQMVYSEHFTGWHRFKSYFSILNYDRNSELKDETSFAKSFQVYKVEESFSLEKLELLEQVLRGLPAFFIQANEDLGKVSESISLISTQCQADGFFPLRNLQLRLIPSIEALLDESARVGATDPVSAFENPVKLAVRQIQDAAMITGKVSDIRKRVFPAIRLAVKNLEANGISTVWIDECYFAHSKALETLTNFALLWPIATKMQGIADQLDSTYSRIIRTEKISCTIERTALPNIDKMEARIAEVRKTAANRIEVDPSLILEEGNFNPTERLRMVHQVIQMVKERCSCGQIDEAEIDLPFLDFSLAQVEWLLQIAEYILEKGDAFAIDVTTRLDSVAKRLPQILSKFEAITRRNSLGALDLNARFDVHVFSKDLIANYITGMDSKIREVTSILKRSRKCYRFGKLFRTSSELQKAAAQVRQLENWIQGFEEQAYALEQVELSIPTLHADLRWRYRSLSSKASDRRCRQRTLSELNHLGNSLDAIKNLLGAPSQNPFSLRHKLEFDRRKIGEIEDMIFIDQQWHSIATEAIKHSARNLRAHSSVLRKLADLGPFRNLETYQLKYNLLRQQLENLQGFIEEKHLDWDETFVEGISLLIESAEQICLINDGDQKVVQGASNLIREAAHQFRSLLNWNNEYCVEIDRKAGFDLLDEATIALVAGNFEEARFKANLSKQKAESALNQANSLTKRVVLKIETEKHQLCDKIINSQPAGESTEVSPFLGLQEYLSKRTVFELGFSRNEILINTAELTYKGPEPKVLPNGADEIPAETSLQNARIGLSHDKSAA